MSNKPKFARLEPSEDLEEMACPMSIEFAVVLTAKIADMPALQAAMQEIAEQALQRLQKEGHRAFLQGAQVRPLSREELLSIVPRKCHFEREGKHICATAFVSPKNLTQDDAAVTCKLCLKMRESERSQKNDA